MGRGKLIAAIVIAVVVFSGLYLAIWKVKKEMSDNEGQFTRGTSKTKDKGHQENNPNIRAQVSIREIKTITGTITKTFDPKTGNTRFLTVSAFVIDLEKLEGIDFSKPSNTIPNIKKDFQVAVDSTVKIKNGTMKSISAGDFIRATSDHSIYDSDNFTATEVEIIKKAGE